MTVDLLQKAEFTFLCYEDLYVFILVDKVEND